MKYELILKPIARSRSGTEYGTGPVMLYEVDGLPEGQRISVRNIRPQSQEAVWEVGEHAPNWTGAFKTPQDALLELQKEFDSVEEIRR